MRSEIGAARPKIAIYKFASCDGCQLTLLDAEAELLDIAGAFEIAYFPEATRTVAKGPYDIGLVEGSITTHSDAERIQLIRRQCRKLVAIGACSTAGGIQALRNWQHVDEMLRCVYATPSYVSTLRTSTPIADHVPVDFELRGCPISKKQLLELLCAVLAGRRPNIPTYSLCMECKRAGQVCIAVTHGEPCMGPVTQAGCGALCPSFGRPCFGCFGPSESANTSALTDRMRKHGSSGDQIQRTYRLFNAWAWQFREASEEAQKK